MAKKKQRRQSVTQLILAEVSDKLADVEHDLTRKNYYTNCKKFVKYCRENHPDCRTLEQCIPYIQEWSDFLQLEGKYSASTIHTYLAACCRACDVPLDTIKKPLRITSQYTRGRGNPNKTHYRTVRDENAPQYKELVTFARMVGIRESEIFNLRKNNFGYDNFGNFYVHIRNGKGGKNQKQRLNSKADEEYIKTFFDGSDDFVFDRTLKNNELNIHKLRAESAYEFYHIMCNRCETEPGFREELEKQVIQYFNENNIDKKTGKPKHFNRRNIEGNYVLRGENRRLAIEKGQPIIFDKLCLYATSVYKLSHFRNSVCVASYLCSTYDWGD